MQYTCSLVGGIFYFFEHCLCLLDASTVSISPCLILYMNGLWSWIWKRLMVTWVEELIVPLASLDFLFYLKLFLLRVWESLSTVTCCRSLVIIYDGHCIMQIGMAAKSSANDGEAEDVDANKLMQGSLYQGIINSKAREYFLGMVLL